MIIVPPTINFHTLAPELDPKLNFTFNEPQKREVKVAISNTFWLRWTQCMCRNQKIITY